MFNTQKWEFAKDRLEFLGHIISKDGVREDPAKTTAVFEMKPSQNIAELQRFMGMVNQVGKFSPKIAELTQPLQLLLGKKHSWTWNEFQQKAFFQVKAELTKPTVLGHYNSTAQTKMSAGTLSFRLGAILLQKIHGTWKPIVYAFRSVTQKWDMRKSKRKLSRLRGTVKSSLNISWKKNLHWDWS